MEVSDWRSEVLDTVQADSQARLETDPSSAHELEFDFVEVTYPNQPNTLQTLARASEDVKAHTRIIVRPARETIQFKHTHKELTDGIEATPLIQKILDEDIPVRRQFSPEYSIHENCIIVKSPEVLPVQLFQNTLTRIWRLTGLYEQDGIYHQRFEQEKPHESIRPVTEDPIETYGKYRMQQIAWSVSIPCPECEEGSVKYEPSEQHDKFWAWLCDSCVTEYGVKPSLKSLLESLNPLWSREKIRETVRETGFDAVHG